MSPLSVNRQLDGSGAQTVASECGAVKETACARKLDIVSAAVLVERSTTKM